MRSITCWWSRNQHRVLLLLLLISFRLIDSRESTHFFSYGIIFSFDWQTHHSTFSRFLVNFLLMLFVCGFSGFVSPDKKKEVRPRDGKRSRNSLAKRMNPSIVNRKSVRIRSFLLLFSTEDPEVKKERERERDANISRKRDELFSSYMSASAVHVCDEGVSLFSPWIRSEMSESVSREVYSIFKRRGSDTNALHLMPEEDFTVTHHV